MFTATTILAVKKDGHTAVAGDGQVTMIAMEIWCVLPWSSPKSGGGIGCSKSWKLF